jgi:uncharacterized membrane protein (DUF4010 family)
MNQLELFQRLGIALLLGLLVGLQRERAASRLAGLRTFPLISVLGAVAALLSREFGGWVVATGFIALAAMVVLGNIQKMQSDTFDPGVTTEVAILLMYAVGAYVIVGSLSVAVAIGAGTAILLQFKGELHGIASKLGDSDLRAIMQFALITCIILPVVPNETYGPLGVINPYEIWLMVVLIVGISLGGYVIYKFFGMNAGMLLAGLLGGAISSTATTMSYARRAAMDPQASLAAAIVIMIASSVVYLRVLLEISAVSMAFLPRAAGPIAVMLALSLLPVSVLWWRVRNYSKKMPEQGNPTELKSAVGFALLYGFVRLTLAAAREYWGDQGLFAVAVLSGLTDMDAITLSTAQMVEQELVDPNRGWRLIITATVANLLFKVGMVAVVGSRRLLALIAGAFAIPVFGGSALILLWP